MNVFDYFFTDSKSLDKDLILGRAETASYQEIFQKSLSLAAKIKEEIGENNNILVLFPNSSWFLVPYLAIFKSGNVCQDIQQAIQGENGKPVIFYFTFLPVAANFTLSRNSIFWGTL